MSDRTGARVTFLGHATTLIEMDGARVLTDPILRARVGPLTRADGAPRAALWSGVDAVLVSHSHWDHLDYGSLRMLGTDRLILAARGMGAAFRARGFHQVTELEPGDEARVGPLRIVATHAAHKGFGPPVGGTDLCLGFIVRGSRGIYFAGDTAFFEGMAAFDVGLDVALLPVWGWGPTARPSEHLDPMGAARAAAVIKPRIAIPIHWGTLHPVGLSWMRPSTRIDPPHQFAQLARRLAPGTVVRVLPNGGSLDLSAGDRRTLPSASLASERPAP